MTSAGGIVITNDAIYAVTVRYGHDGRTDIIYDDGRMDIIS